MRYFQFGNPEWEQLDRRWRATFVNSLSGFKSAALIGTRSSEGQENVSIFSQIVHLGAAPALLGIVFRPDSVERHTLSNLRNTGKATLNLIPADQAAAAHQTSARYAADFSEFKGAGLTSAYVKGFEAPFVGESPVRAALSLAEEHTLNINGTILVICKLLWAEVPEEILHADGYVDLGGAGILTTNGLDAYHSTKLVGRYAYAKADQSPRLL
jgi:flavin reductase (DIM6/NTAB) family NADH-FMN oxidoreductase RutF